MWLTGVWMSTGRWSLICCTILNMSIATFDSIQLHAVNMLISTPVLPTPALQAKQHRFLYILFHCYSTAALYSPIIVTQYIQIKLHVEFLLLWMYIFCPTPFLLKQHWIEHTGHPVADDPTARWVSLPVMKLSCAKMAEAPVLLFGVETWQ